MLFDPASGLLQDPARCRAGKQVAVGDSHLRSKIGALDMNVRRILVLKKTSEA
jgi:hypothetical protein